jgi:hypothetical protein
MPLTSPRFRGIARFQNAADNKPPISRGEVGEPVRILQQSLIELGYWMDISTRRFNTPDGIFGPETEDRVKKFQRSKGIADDGIVGKETMAKLDAALPNAGPKMPPLPSSKTFFKYRVRIHLRSLALTEVAMSFQEANARMIYSQYGIYLDVRSGMSLMLSPAETKKFEDLDVGECLAGKPTDALKALHKLGLQGVGVNEVVIYFVPKIFDETGVEINGCAALDPARPAVVVSSTSTQWTMAHELGHVLLGNFDPVHSTDNSNIMFIPTADIVANPPGFSPEQLTAIRASRYTGLY